MFTGDGTVFKIDTSGKLTTLHAFTGPDGATPSAVLIEGSDGNFYGTTSLAGATNFGTVFKLTPADEFTTLHDLTGATGQILSPR